MNIKREHYETELAAYLYGELTADMNREIEAHLESCSACRQEMNTIKKVFNGADTLNSDLENAVKSVDWESLPDRIAERVFDQKITGLARSKSRFRAFWRQPQIRSVSAALFLGLFLGAVLTLLVMKPPGPAEPAAGDLLVSIGALESMDVEIARRTALDYLDRSQYLLLDLVQSPPEKAAVFWQSEFAAQQARSLLSKKKYIDQQLDNFQMAKAKALCDQIELLFLELSQISQELSSAEMMKLQSLIQERQLILKIKLVKKELQESEV